MNSIAFMSKNPSKEAMTIAALMAQKPGLSNVSIARYMGVSDGLVSQWVTGRRPVPADKAVRLAEYMGADPKAISAKYAAVHAQEPVGSAAVPAVNEADADERRLDLTIARLENDIDSLRFAIAAMVSVMTVHRPAEGAAVAKAMRRHVPAKFVRQGYLAELLDVLDKGAAG